MTDEPKAGSAPVEKACCEECKRFHRHFRTDCCKCRTSFGPTDIPEAPVDKAYKAYVLAVENRELRAELAQAKERIDERGALLAAAREEIKRLNKERERRKGSAVDRLHNVCEGLEASDAEREQAFAAEKAARERAEARVKELEENLRVEVNACKREEVRSDAHLVRVHELESLLASKEESNG